MSEYKDFHHSCFQFIKRDLTDRRSIKRDFLFRQFDQRFRYTQEVLDEASIEVDEL